MTTRRALLPLCSPSTVTSTWQLGKQRLREARRFGQGRTAVTQGFEPRSAHIRTTVCTHGGLVHLLPPVLWHICLFKLPCLGTGNDQANTGPDVSIQDRTAGFPDITPGWRVCCSPRPPSACSVWKHPVTEWLCARGRLILAVLLLKRH